MCRILKILHKRFFFKSVSLFSLDWNDGTFETAKKNWNYDIQTHLRYDYHPSYIIFLFSYDIDVIRSESKTKNQKQHHLNTKIQTNFQYYEFCYYFLISILTEQLKDICKEYFERMYLCEGQKWDLEHEVRKRDWEVLPKNKTKQNFYKPKNTKKIFTKTTLICLMRWKTKTQTNLLSPFLIFFSHF